MTRHNYTGPDWSSVLHVMFDKKNETLGRTPTVVI